MPTLLALAVLISALLVVTTIGYLVVLRIVVWLRPRRESAALSQPRIAIVVPTLNEATFIAGKIVDLLQSDYPRDRVTIYVVDGGSTDGTVEIVQQVIDGGAPVELIRMARTSGHGEQGLLALRCLSEEIVVLTDADGRLHPSCISRLVSCLENDSQLAVVGAAVHPDSTLAEERLHWHFLNRLWWLEGESLAAGSVSGVCYGVRRSLLGPLGESAAALDMHLALTASARGRKVRLCREAVATELRVPQSAAALIRWRRQRGRHYADELRRAWRQPHARLGPRVACGVRLWHVHVTPHLAAAFAVLLALICLQTWQWALALGAVVIVPACGVYIAASTRPTRPTAGTFVASGRLLALTWLSLLTLRPRAGAFTSEIPDVVSVDHDGVPVRRAPVSQPASVRRSGDAAERVQPAV